jgi:hypothetical protein
VHLATLQLLQALLLWRQPVLLLLPPPSLLLPLVWLGPLLWLGAGAHELGLLEGLWLVAQLDRHQLWDTALLHPLSTKTGLQQLPLHGCCVCESPQALLRLHVLPAQPELLLPGLRLLLLLVRPAHGLGQSVPFPGMVLVLLLLLLLLRCCHL